MDSRGGQEGRNPQPGAGIVDSPTVQGAETVERDSRGYDAGKKINRAEAVHRHQTPSDSCSPSGPEVIAGEQQIALGVVEAEVVGAWPGVRQTSVGAKALTSRRTRVTVQDTNGLPYVIRFDSTRPLQTPP